MRNATLVPGYGGARGGRGFPVIQTGIRPQPGSPPAGNGMLSAHPFYEWTAIYTPLPPRRAVRAAVTARALPDRLPDPGTGTTRLSHHPPCELQERGPACLYFRLHFWAQRGGKGIQPVARFKG